MALDRKRLEGLYYDMVAIRKFDEAVEEYARNGTVPGFVHLSIGQEASQAGIVRALRPTDYKFPDHRSHGAICLCGTDRKLVMAEIFGRETGVNGGRGGSMHVNDISCRNMGFNGVQGSTVATCLGTAFASVYRKTDEVTAVILGDGTLGEGTCHESMNMAATWKLPILYCLINNQYAISTHYRESHPQERLAEWASGYGVPAETLDGNDLEFVVEAVERAAARARAGEGPTLLELVTYRWQGHFSGDPASYRPEAELASWKERCPIVLARRRLEERGCSASALDGLEAAADAEIRAAVDFALASPWPDPRAALEHVYAGLDAEDWR